jgi:hypothetical protein
MITTVECDEEALHRVMKLTGLNSTGEALNFALAEAERNCHLNRLLSEPFFEGAPDPIIDPSYELTRA